MLKKLFLIGAVSIGAYFMYGYLPASWREQGKAVLAGINFSRLSPANLLPELKAKAEPYREKLLPENPVKKRGELIQELTRHLETIERSSPPTTAKERLAIEAATTESKAILAELREENPKAGVINSALLGIIEKIVPAAENSNSGQTSAVCR